MVYGLTQGVGLRFVRGVEEFGYATSLLAESLYWILVGAFRQQPVRLRAIAIEMQRIGVEAIPVIAVLAFANGVMTAVQGIYTLADYGAQLQVVRALALSVTREFGALIVGIAVAGRSGSAIAARIGVMQMSQEVDALQVLGVNPVRFLVAPVLIAMLVMVPALTILADAVALFGGGLVAMLQLNLALPVYGQMLLDNLTPGDIAQGLVKSLVFAVLIAMVSTSNGFSVRGGADGLGAWTTRSVVLCIAAIIVADMIFTIFLSR